MLYTLSLITLAALGGFVSLLVAGLIGTIAMPAAFLGAIITALIGWGCACGIDRLEQNQR